MSKVFVTGSKGFIGRLLCGLLESNSYEIIDTGDIDELDLCKREEVKTIPRSEIIVHLAGYSYIPEAFNNPQDFYHNNLLSTLNILEKAREDGSKVIFFSTYVYGPPQYQPIDEDHPKNPKNPYTQSKVIGEALCEAYHRDFGVPVTIFRPFNIYGSGQNPAFFIPTIISQVDNEEIQLNDSRPKRDFVYIDDVINAVYLSILSGENTFSIYNIGTGVSTSVKEVVELIINIAHSKAKVYFTDQIRQGEILDTIADISKIKNELGWTPKTPLDTGIRSCIDHFRKDILAGDTSE